MIEQPNFQSDKEVAFWINGKASRKDVLEVQTEVQKLQKVVEQLQHMVSMQNNMVGKVFSYTQLNGMQNETMVRMMDIAVPGYRENFQAQFAKTVELVTFVETINPKGKDANKTMKEKIELVREWQKNPEHLTIRGFHFGLDEYLKTEQKEFTPEEVAALKDEFDIKDEVEEVVATPEVVEAQNESTEKPV